MDPMWAHILFTAEREGFEPPVRLRTSVFKTDALDHSAIFPSRSAARSATSDAD